MNLSEVVLEEMNLLLLSLLSKLRTNESGICIHDKLCNLRGCKLDLGVRQLVSNGTMQLPENDKALVGRFCLHIS